MATRKRRKATFVDTTVMQATAGTLSVALQALAEEMTREALADPEVRKSLREAVKRRIVPLLDAP